MRTQIWSLLLATALGGCGGDDAAPPAARDASADAARTNDAAAAMDGSQPGQDAQALDAQSAYDASYELPDACSATACPKGWKCVLQQVECVRAPCYPVADCQAPD